MKIDSKLLTKNQRWFRSNKLVALSTLLIKDSYCEWVFIDGTHVKAHQHSSGGNESLQGISKGVTGRATHDVK